MAKVEKKQGITRGDVYWVMLGDTEGSEQSGLRPFIILQNDVGNKYAPTTIGAPLSAQIAKKKLPTHVRVKRNEIILQSGYDIDELSYESDILLEQVRTISKTRIMENGKIGKFGEEVMKKVDKALLISLGLPS